MKNIGLAVLALLLVMMIWGGLLSNRASSQVSQLIESRLSNLEADFNRLQSQVNQIQSQLGQGRSSPSPSTNIPTTGGTGSRRSLAPQERDRILDRLATLVVELKQQVNKLETRVSKLESRR